MNFRLRPWLLLLPIAELYVLFKASAMFGFLTVLLLGVAASIGFRLLAHQGLTVWTTLQATLARGEPPSRDLVDGALSMAGAVLLILPGFLSDLAAAALLIPGSRRWLLRHLAQRIDALRATRGTSAERVIDGEFRREE